MVKLAKHVKLEGDLNLQENWHEVSTFHDPSTRCPVISYVLYDEHGITSRISRLKYGVHILYSLKFVILKK
jgi:hypothetical protein